MIKMTLRQLRYFDALARHGHFGRAAEACSISQPALSMQIKEMEEALGGVLLERSARQVALTKFGEEIVQRVRDILRSVDELGDFARASRDRLAGRLRIGMIPTIAPYLLPKVIENLARMHPELDIHVRETLTPKLIKEVAEGRLDTAIVALPVSEPSLTEVACSRKISCWCGRARMRERRCRAGRCCARCGCCCSKRDTASAIRRCRSATCSPRRRARCWTQARCRRWCRWSAPASASP